MSQARKDFLESVLLALGDPVMLWTAKREAPRRCRARAHPPARPHALAAPRRTQPPAPNPLLIEPYVFAEWRLGGGKLRADWSRVRASVPLLQHSSDFQAASHCGADRLIERGRSTNRGAHHDLTASVAHYTRFLAADLRLSRRAMNWYPASAAACSVG
jgi:hypothetical protein